MQGNNLFLRDCFFSINSVSVDFFDFVFFFVETGAGGEGGFFAEFVLDVGPDFVAGVADRLEEAASGFGDGLEIADQCGAVWVFAEKFLQARVLAHLAVALYLLKEQL